MRVALSFPDCHRRGGVERVVFESARFLATRGHEVTVYANEFEPDLAGMVRHVFVPALRQPTFLRGASFFRNCARALDPSRYDAVGSFGCVSPFGGVMWVQSVHRAWIDVSRRHRSFQGRFRQRLNPFHPITLAMERRHFAGRRYRKLIALTEGVKADLGRWYGVPGSDVEVLSNGFSADEFHPGRVAADRGRIRRAWGFGGDEFVVLFVANELERKGFGPLIRAIRLADDKRLRLIVVGRVNADAYAAELSALGLTDRVRFIGSSADVGSCYAAADLFALPTEYEAWGLVIVEAMATGLPVLTSRLAGASVAVTEGHSGLLIDDPRDPGEIAAKLKALVGRASVGRESIAASVTRYEWSTLLLEYEAILMANRGTTS